MFRSLNWFLFYSGLSCISFVQIVFKPIIYYQFTAPEFMRPYLQLQFVEESEIAQNAMKSFQSIFKVLCKMHI